MKNINLSFAFMLSCIPSLIFAANIDGNLGSGEYDLNSGIAMINGGGNDKNNDNNYNFTNAYYKTDANTSYVLVLINDPFLNDATINNTNGDDNFVKNGVEKKNGEKLVDGAGGGLTGAEFKYIKDVNGKIIGWEASWPTVANEDPTDLLFHAQVFSVVGDCTGDDSCTSSVCVGKNCEPVTTPGGEIPIDGGLGILAMLGISLGIYTSLKN
jgi:hypothetical protein